MSLDSLFQFGSFLAAVLVAVLVAFALSSLGANLVERRLVQAPPDDRTTDEPSPAASLDSARDGIELVRPDGSPAAPTAPRASVRWHSQDVPRARPADVPRARPAEGAKHKN